MVVVPVFLSSSTNNQHGAFSDETSLGRSKRGLGFFLEEASLWPYGVGC